MGGGGAGALHCALFFSVLIDLTVDLALPVISKAPPDSILISPLIMREKWYHYAERRVNFRLIGKVAGGHRIIYTNLRTSSYRSICLQAEIGGTLELLMADRFVNLSRVYVSLYDFRIY